jgi:hypothetical protein
VADPETLADLALVQRIATTGAGSIRCERMNYLAKTTYEQVVGDTADYDAVLRATRPRHPLQPSGPDWDFEDPAENRQHLPRLSALFQRD